MENTAQQIIDFLGGPAAVGRRFTISTQAVSDWGVKGRIPAGWAVDVWIACEGHWPIYRICPPRVLSVPESLQVSDSMKAASL